jgi:hypothetical protein
MMYKLDRHVYDKINWTAFEHHRDLIANIINNMQSLPKYKVVAFVRLLGGADSVGNELYKAIQEIMTKPKPRQDDSWILNFADAVEADTCGL